MRVPPSERQCASRSPFPVPSLTRENLTTLLWSNLTINFRLANLLSTGDRALVSTVDGPSTAPECVLTRQGRNYPETLRYISGRRLRYSPPPSTYGLQRRGERLATSWRMARTGSGMTASQGMLLLAVVLYSCASPTTLGAHTLPGRSPELPSALRGLVQLRGGGMDATQKIADIEKEIARTQKNKSTMSHLCLLKAQLAKLRRSLPAVPAKQVTDEDAEENASGELQDDDMLEETATTAFEAKKNAGVRVAEDGKRRMSALDLQVGGAIHPPGGWGVRSRV